MFNPAPFKRSMTVPCELEIPLEWECDSFAGSFGYAAALSFVVAVTLIFLAVLQFRAMKQKDAANS